MLRNLISLLLLGTLAACSPQESTEATERAPELRPTHTDDANTTNDESNDQDLGSYGTRTLCVTNHGSGNSYPLDADMDGLEVTTIYFKRGGNVDFSGCELDDDFEGQCEDHEGRGWSFEGEC